VLTLYLLTCHHISVKIIGEMPKTLTVLKLGKLSRLQKSIIAEALQTWYRAPIIRAWGARQERVGIFRQEAILQGFYHLEKVRRLKRWERRSQSSARERDPKRAAATAALSRAIRSLKRRGLLEKTGPKSWRLTKLGQTLAPGICAGIVKPSKRELTPKLKEIYCTRRGEGSLSKMSFATFCRHALEGPEAVASQAQGVNVQLDLSSLNQIGLASVCANPV